MRLRTPLSLVFGLLLSAAAAFGAESWRLTSPALYEVGVAAIAVDPRTPSTIYVGGNTGSTLRQTAALLRSDDGGFSWRRFGIPGLSVQSLNLDPVNPDVVYVGTYGGGFLKSVDRGESWTAFQPGGLPWVSATVLDRANPGTLYVAIAGAGIFRSTDGGANWISISGPLGVIEEVVTSLALDPSVPNRLLAIAAGGLYRTDDGGTTWVLLSRVVDQILLAVPGALYGGRSVGLEVSTDGGQTWSPIGTGLPPPGAASFRALIQDPANPGVLYIGTATAGVFRSVDGGRTWTPFNEGMTHRFVGALLAPPSGDPFLYAGTDAGLYDYRARPEFQITLPAVASLRGVPPAFFHSDIWVFNGSTDSEATVTATYRCLSGSPCQGPPQTFTIPPRQVKTFRDIAVSLFNAPESAGAVEFESDHLIVVTSRLYTPESSRPTTGMFVPGLKPEQASQRQVLTSLSHSAGFRTNIGFYNGTDNATFVTLAFFEASGVSLGETVLFAAPRRPLQVNDDEIFQRLGISHDAPSFYCIATSSRGETPIHTYAAVIDNLSLDPFFVPGQDADAMAESKITLPAVASLHGAAGTFFHSDVRIWNAAETAASVTARFACFEGDCGERVFTVAPRQMAVWDDVVTSLFASAPSGGAIEFVSSAPLVVTSRLFTPSAAEPTFGMFVPGLPPRRASAAVVINGLSHEADPSSGSRVNVGVFNQADVAQVVTYRLFDGAGQPLGQTARLFGPREFVQVNDVFAFLGVTSAVESSFCLIEGSEQLPLFAYAAVIDNRSQDPIFIPGEDDPEHPPIVPLAPK